MILMQIFGRKIFQIADTSIYIGKNVCHLLTTAKVKRFFGGYSPQPLGFIVYLQSVHAQLWK